MTNPFGKFAERPDTPDFWTLSSILIAMDSAMDNAANDEEKEVQWQKFIAATGCGEKEIVYVAFQRVFRVLGITDFEDIVRIHQQDSELITKMVALYADAFITGTKYAQLNQDLMPSDQEG